MTCDINENDIRDVFFAYEVKKAQNTHIFRIQFFGKNCISLQRKDAKLPFIYQFIAILPGGYSGVMEFLRPGKNLYYTFKLRKVAATV